MCDTWFIDNENNVDDTQPWPRALDVCSKWPKPLNLPYVSGREHEGQQQGLLSCACFLLLLDRRETRHCASGLLHNGPTSEQGGRNQILPRLSHFFPFLCLVLCNEGQEDMAWRGPWLEHVLLLVAGAAIVTCGGVSLCGSRPPIFKK